MKNITRNISLALTIGLSVLTADMALAQQGKGNKKSEVAEEEHASKQHGKSDKAKEKESGNRPTDPRARAEERRAEAKAKAQQQGNKAEEKEAKGNNGNAYGKNKGELSGREFGQARAAAAQLNNQEKQEKLSKVVTEGDAKVTEARGRVARALEELERNRKARSISDAEYNERKARITRAEQAIQVLEQKVLEGKQLVITVE